MELDDVDRMILYLLQKESRPDLTHEAIAERIGVSSSTVSNRLTALKENDVLVGYLPEIDYERAGVPHHVLFVCTAPIADRTALAEDAITLEGVVNVRELLTGKRNLHIEIACLDTRTVEVTAEKLDSVGLEIEQSEILRREYSRPFSHFGSRLEE